MFYINLVLNGARERYGSEVFATEESAIHFGLAYLPEEVDFEVESLEVNSAHDEQPDCEVISLCDYRRKNGTSKTA